MKNRFFYSFKKKKVTKSKYFFQIFVFALSQENVADLRAKLFLQVHLKKQTAVSMATW